MLIGVAYGPKTAALTTFGALNTTWSSHLTSPIPAWRSILPTPTATGTRTQTDRHS